MPGDTVLPSSTARRWGGDKFSPASLRPPPGLVRTRYGGKGRLRWSLLAGTAWGSCAGLLQSLVMLAGRKAGAKSSGLFAHLLVPCFWLCKKAGAAEARATAGRVGLPIGAQKSSQILHPGHRENSCLYPYDPPDISTMTCQK